jgi:deoxyadenosine/deoxycytidine kinase
MNIAPLVSSKAVRVEICGGIASGKTTLANLLRSVDRSTVLEDFSSNPFWRAFYADPNNTAFETEITFLLQHYHQIKLAADQKPSVCDFSLFLDYAYAQVTLKGSRFETFEHVYNEVCGHISPPSLLVHLECEPAVELERIRARGRDAENSITLDYLKSLNDCLDALVSKLPKAQKVLKLNSVICDFAHVESEKTSVIKQVLDNLKGIE